MPISDAFRPFHIPGHDVPLGSLVMQAAALLTARGVLVACETRGHLVLPDGPVTDSLEAIRETLCAADLIEPPRHEAMPVRLTAGGKVYGTVDRSAVRALGLWITKVHVNGLVRRPDGTVAIWLSRRAAHAAWNPDRFDTMVAGGVAANQTPSSAVRAECWEEAGLPPEAVAGLAPARRIAVHYVSDRGLHREMLLIHDLELDPDFVPCCQDGEIAWARLFDPGRVRALLDMPAEMKFSSSLVCRDLLERLHGSG